MSKERELLERIVKADMVEYMRLMDEAEELLAQPEQEQEPEAWGYKKRVTYKPEGSEEEEIIPLYTSPPKREPLSEQVIAEQAVWATNSKHSFKDGVRWAEQQHGITGGE